MKIKIAVIFFQFACLQGLYSQVKQSDVTIIRDKWGVPHIYGISDADAAYGLAWATAEDAFGVMQETLLATRSRLSSVKGKDAAVVDVVNHLIATDELVEANYRKELSPDFIHVLEAYAQGVNDYAAAHPKEIIAKKLFPIKPNDLLKGYMLALTFMTHVHQDLKKIFDDKVVMNESQLPQGSNAFAFNRSKTKDGSVLLGINSHQPLEGSYAWYEAHMVSEEGLNILGGTFPGGVCIFLGVNENLGWAHTLNDPDLADVYKLEMHPKEKLTYRYDGKWEKLRERTIKLKVKMGPLKIPVKRTYYWSKHGAVVPNKSGYFAIRFPANMSVKASEQWFRMDKAKNFTEFKKALEIQGLPGMNIVYADKNDTIYYLSNANMPRRAPGYDWTKALPGDTSALVWTTDFFPIDSLPHQLNPECGYLFNTNNTPLNATCNLMEKGAMCMTPEMGYLEHDNNRSLRFKHLIERYDKISYEEFKKVKYDQFIMTPAYTHALENLEDMFRVDTIANSDIAEIVKRLNQWDRNASVNSNGAAIFVLAVKHYIDIIFSRGGQFEVGSLTSGEIITGLRSAKTHLLKHFGTLDVKLGDIQKHVRGNVELPIGGSIDVLAAMHSSPYKDGKFKAAAGESYIELVRFSRDGDVVIETVNSYGASNNPDSPHFTDQMDMFVKQKLKPMSLKKGLVLKNAVRTYHPGE